MLSVLPSTNEKRGGMRGIELSPVSIRGDNMQLFEFAFDPRDTAWNSMKIQTGDKTSWHRVYIHRRSWFISLRISRCSTERDTVSSRLPRDLARVTFPSWKYNLKLFLLAFRIKSVEFYLTRISTMFCKKKNNRTTTSIRRDVTFSNVQRDRGEDCHVYVYDCRQCVGRHFEVHHVSMVLVFANFRPSENVLS